MQEWGKEVGGSLAGERAEGEEGRGGVRNGAVAAGGRAPGGWGVKVWESIGARLVPNVGACLSVGRFSGGPREVLGVGLSSPSRGATPQQERTRHARPIRRVQRHHCPKLGMR
eukprot:scaffold19678_cov95-Isochrysis_galbana.AAC.2